MTVEVVFAEISDEDRTAIEDAVDAFFACFPMETEGHIMAYAVERIAVELFECAAPEEYRDTLIEEMFDHVRKTLVIRSESDAIGIPQGSA